MKWRGRRQSKNVEDRTKDPIILIPDGMQLQDGSLYDSETMDNPQTKRARQDKAHKDSMDGFDRDYKIGKKLHELEKKGKIPTPSPRPSNKSNRIQVTPGKWITK